MGEFSVHSSWLSNWTRHLPEDKDPNPAVARSFFKDHSTSFRKEEKSYPLRSQLYDRKDPKHFFCNQQIEQWKATRSEDDEGNNLFEIISKVISVSFVILSVLMPLAFCYLPLWVPLGIGIPLGIALMGGKVAVEYKIDVHKKENEFVPYLSGVTGKHTLKAFEPIGVGDLPLVDRRLKYDRLKKKEENPLLQKKQPKAWDSRYDVDQPSHKKGNVSAWAARLDLEVNNSIKFASALQFSEKTERVDQWQEIRKKQSKLIESAQENDAAPFAEADEELGVNLSEPKTIRSKGGKVQVPSHPSLEYQSPSAENRYDSLVQLYRHGFSNHYKSLHRLYEEGVTLYGPATKDQSTPYAAWATFIKLAGEVKSRLETFGQNPTNLSPKFLIYNLISETRLIKRTLEKWVAEHPEKKHAAIQAELDGYTGQNVISKKQVECFEAWIKTLPPGRKPKIKGIVDQLPLELKPWLEKNISILEKRVTEAFEMAKQQSAFVSKILTKHQLRQFALWLQSKPAHENPKIRKAIQEKDFPKKLVPWIKQFPDMPEKEVRTVYDAAFKACEKLEKALESWPSIPKEAEAIEKYQKEVLVPLKEAVTAQGKGSLWYYLTYTQKTPFNNPKLSPIKTNPYLPPAVRPEPIRPTLSEIHKEIDDPARLTDETQNAIMKLRNVEEIHLNKMLRHVDNEMTSVHYALKYGLRVPLALLIAIEGIVAYYFSSPWIFWGLSVLAAAGEGIAYFVDNELNKKEIQKKTIQLQYILRDRPDIDIVPGTHPHLEQLQEVQKQYGLEGVRPTWARLLAEGADAPEESFATIAEEGSEKARPLVQDALLHLYTQKDRCIIQLRNNPERVQTLTQEKKIIELRIEEIEKVLYPERKKKLTKTEEKAEKKAEEERTAYKAERAALKKLKEVTRKILANMHALFQATEDKEKERIQGEIQEHRKEKERIQGEIQKHRIERGAIPNSYSLVMSERQIVDEMLDLLVKEKLTLEHEQRFYEKAKGSFEFFNKKLTPEFTELPVSQDEIDFILDSLKEEQLDDPSMSIVPLLLHIKKEIANGSFQFLMFKEKKELQKIPSKVRLAYAKALRKLRIYQLEPKYESYANVLAQHQKRKDDLAILENEIKLFKGEYNRLSDLCKSLDFSRN